MSVRISAEGITTVAAIVSDNPVARMQARAICAGWVDGYMNWVNAELARPEVSQMDLIYVITTLNIQSHASVAAQLVSEGGDRAMVDLYKELLDQTYLAHVERVRREA